MNDLFSQFCQAFIDKQIGFSVFKLAYHLWHMGDTEHLERLKILRLT